jgi:hypothetical protein
MRALKEDAGGLVTDKDPFVQADAARLRAEAIKQAQVPKLTPLDQSRDCPETMIIEPLVWSKLQVTSPLPLPCPFAMLMESWILPLVE